MRLKYKILWFEDDSDYITEDIGPRVTNYLREDLGFEPEIIHKTSDTDVDTLVTEEWDLIVTDLNLTQGGDETGQKIIEHVRNQNILTDVLLYSSLPQAIEDIKKKNPGIERISFAAGRSALYDKLHDLIFLTVRKVQDINNLRGMVITEAIDIEIKVKDLLISKLEKLTPEKLEEIRQKKIQNQSARVEALKTSVAKSVTQFVEDLFTFSELHDELMGMLSEALAEVNRSLGDPRKAKVGDPGMLKKKSLESLKGELQGMKDDVVYLRNDMAHAKAGKHPQTGRPYLVSKYAGKERHFDDAECIKVRKNILKHFQCIEDATSHL